MVFQERPAEGRETSYGEEFPLIFPSIVLELPDSPTNMALTVIPSAERERIIQAELHNVPDGDRRPSPEDKPGATAIFGELVSS